MKKNRVIIPALGLIALGTAASITGTVAWFSANQRVSITGMTVKTKVSSNLSIAGDTLGSTAKLDDSYFSTSDLAQTVKGILEPASTVDGKDFYYTTNAKADGDATTDSYIKYGTEAALEGDDATTYQDAFSKAYNVTKTEATSMLSVNGAVPFVDYVFQLKVTNAENASRDLKITALTLTYTKSATETDVDKAFRVALDHQDITSAAPVAGFNASSSCDGIFAPTGAENHSDDGGKNFAVSAVNAVSQLTISGNKYNNTDIGVIDTIASGATKYYKVALRLYIEGEDTTCTTSTFAALTGQWDLGVTVTLDAATAAVSALTMTTAA